MKPTGQHSDLTYFSEQSLLESACKQTGLTDFGDDHFRIGLKVLLESYEHADLHILGRTVLRGELIRLLSNRLRIQEDLKRHPEIVQASIHRPLFIVGLARTGTTLLFHLLAQDSVARVPFLWELLWPSPPPSSKSTEPDPRIEMAQQRLKLLYEIAPQMRTVHFTTATSPEECLYLFQNGFAAIDFGVLVPAPRYVEWFLSHDMLAEYRYYLKQLQILQWRRPGGEYWILKSPHHLFALDALLTVFPDACIIQTHRDPQKVIASNCSLIVNMRKLYSNDVSLKTVGEIAVSVSQTAIERAMQSRFTANASQFYDVQYVDLIVDPIGVAKAIYKYFGYTWIPAIEKRMKVWLENNPQHKHGVHDYSMEPFGLKKEEVNERFARYHTQFNIKPE